MSFRKIATILLAVCLAAPIMAQGKRGTASLTIKGTEISISYGRPSLQGRDLLSQMKSGMVWRTGVNQATEIQTTGDLVINGHDLKAGKYTLWTKKTGDDTWALMFHPKTGIWSLPEMKEGFVAELPLKHETDKHSEEQVKITLAEGEDKAVITIAWGTSRLIGAFDVADVACEPKICPLQGGCTRKCGKIPCICSKEKK
jgi:Protein of unknown function (DUF2911)